MTSQETVLHSLAAAHDRAALPADVRRAVLAARLWLIAHHGDVTVGLALTGLIDYLQPERMTSR